ncbi:Acetylglutamate kinase [Actinidia chinensis var. chinensis]|uniref:Acetylglutamate kinase n=1 Tax=Actinidia chinensis var. chinensis TaxID=1590841 RepID=A0A2R6QYX4_ACTCC|nr:Acetylglutamate kinase [Actinidia chinensis var. chinensis]
MAGARVISSSLSSLAISTAPAERSVGRHRLLNFPSSLSTTTKTPIVFNNNNNYSPPFLTPCLKSIGKISGDSSPSDDSKIPPHLRVNIYSESLPFIQKFRGKTIVVKYGGAAMKSQSLQSSVIADIVLLSCVGLRIVLVHGGGPEINHWLTRLGIQPNFLNGLRVTDASTMEVVSMVLVGKLNKHLVSLINNAGATAVGLSGIDARLLTARPSPNSTQLGFVGDIAVVDPSVLPSPSHREQPHPGDCIGGGG